MALIFPARLTRRSSESFWIENAARSGGPSTTGQEQFSASPAGRWRGRFSLALKTDEDFLEARGFVAALDGPATPFLVGPVDWRGQPWNADALTGGLITPNKAAYNRGISPDYDANPDATGAMSFALAAAASANASIISVARTRGGVLKRGQYLALGERLHIITSVNTPDTGQVGSAISLTIRPWTRAAYVLGAPVEFGAPRGLMRLTPDAAAAIEMTASPSSSLAIDLVEAF